MQTVTDRLTVKDALTFVNRHVAKRTTLPVLSNVHVEANVETQTITFTATDLDDTVTVTVASDVSEPGSVLVNRQRLAETVKNGNATVGFRFVPSDGFGTFYVDTVGTVTLPPGPSEDWPELPDLMPGSVWPLYPEDRETLGTVARFASDDQGRPVLTGVQIGDGKAAATDSYRLAVGDVHNGLPSMLWPAVAVKRIARWKITDPSVAGCAGLYVSEPDDVNESYAQRRVAVHATITNGPKRAPRDLRVAYGFRTIPGTFPNYRVLLPEPANVDLTALWVHVDRDAAIRAVKNLEAITGKHRNVPVSLKIEHGRITFTVTDQEHGTGESTVSARVQGPGFTVPTEHGGTEALDDPVPFETAYNPTFLREQLEAMPAGPVAITLRDALKPARFDHVDTDLTGLLMPMRVS